MASGALGTSAEAASAQLAPGAAGLGDPFFPKAGNGPRPAKLFADSVYVRGAMALEALRQRVGGRVFYAILSEWVARHAYANASIAEFTALAEAQSGRHHRGADARATPVRR